MGSRAAPELPEMDDQMHDFIDAGLDAHWSSTLASDTGLAIAPFSPVVATAGITVYTSGQTWPVIGSNDSRRAADADLAEQTLACLTNIDLVLTAAGAARDDIVKVTIFTTRMNEQAIVNEVYLTFFGNHRPARSHVEITRLADPDLLIEIEAIAVIDPTPAG